jgi:hypothetical protein
LATLVSTEIERTGLSAELSNSQRRAAPTRSTLMDETRESPGTRLTGSVARTSSSYRFASVLLSKPESSSTGGRFLTEPFRPFVGGGLIAVIVTGPTT